MALCEQILEHRRVQDLQVELERKERRPVTVQEWAVAAGHPSSHQLMAALQSGRKAERTMVICHQGLVHSVAFRLVMTLGTMSLLNLNRLLLRLRPSGSCFFHPQVSFLEVVLDRNRNRSRRYREADGT